MKHIRKILVPTDFSETADSATTHAVYFAELYRAEITLFHARTIFHDDPAHLDDDLKRVRSRLVQQAREIGHPDVAPMVEVARGISASDAILNSLSEHDFDLVVMGTHGRSGLAHFMLGSVAEEVIRKAPCPVVAVRPPAAGKRAKGPYRRILVGFDFSEHSKAAVRHAGELAGKLGAEVRVFYAFEQKVHPAYYPVLDEMARQLLPDIEKDALQILRHVFAEAGFDNWALEVGPSQNAARDIAKYAKTSNVDLIVLGTHGFSGLDHFLLGSTTERVLRMAPCPVMTVRLTDQESRGSQEESPATGG